MSSNQARASFVEPDPSELSPVRDEDDAVLAAKAVEGIHEAEKVNSIGRFVAKVQKRFRHSEPSGTMASTHWHFAPVLISVVLMLMFGLGILLFFSKPESESSRRPRQARGLSGPDDDKPVGGSSSVQAPVQENQLVGGEAKTADARQNQNSDKDDSTAGKSKSVWQRTGTGGNAASQGDALLPTVGGLQSPATVFIAAGTSPNGAFSPVSALLDPHSADIQLPVGTEIAAHTTNSISSGLDSPVVAVVDRNLEVDGIVVIPQGARVIGNTAGAVRNRVNVRFTSVVLPGQREVSIAALALMNDGSAGLVGKAQGNGHPVLASAGRVATGAAVLATEFVGQSSAGLNQPFSQGDMLRNQLAMEVANQGTHASARLQQPMNVPIINVAANQSIRIFLMSPMRLVGGRLTPTDAAIPSGATENDRSQQAMADAQASYIQTLEAQLAETRAALATSQTGRH